MKAYINLLDEEFGERLIISTHASVRNYLVMSKFKAKILVVDDNNGIRAALKLLLPMHFEQVELIPSPKELMSRLVDFKPDAVLLDMNFKSDINTGNEGLFWLSEIKKAYPLIEVVLFTAYADIQLAVEGMKRGAFDFIVKPWSNDKLIDILSSAVAKSISNSTADGGGAKIGSSSENREQQMIWGTSGAMVQIRRSVEKIAPTDATVLITGENGTGKDVLANEIHRMSSRSGKVMVSVDAGALPETLFESELFGHVKGAFTDAHTERTGKFEQANGGTLFLDEIGNIPLHLQGKLLRVLQNRCVSKLGDTKQIPIDIRLVCATNMDLEQMVRDGRFREDLYYRINTVHIKLPPLRERVDEIKGLSESFLRRFAKKYRREVKAIDGEALAALKINGWKGNIRELSNCIEKAVILSESELLTKADLQMEEEALSGSKKVDVSNNQEVPEYNNETLDMVEERAIRGAMERYGGNLSLVAKSLDISRPTLYSKLKKYNI